AALDGEPDVLLGRVEDERMRIARRRIRHLDLLDLVRRGIVTADTAAQVAGIPDDPVRADDQIVRAGLVRQVALEELAGRRLKAREIVTALPDEPDLVLTGRERVARPTAERHVPFVDRDWIQRLRGGLRGEPRADP